jgi:hypothetical protein
MSALPENRYEQIKEYYRRELQQGFRNSWPFAQSRGMTAAQVVDSSDCEAILHECPSGGLDCARRIGELTVVLLDPIAPGPWWRDLLNYERAWFIQSATTADGPPTNRPRRGISAMCLNFSWDAPEMIKRLQAGASLSAEYRRAVTLVFARNQEGRVFVAEVSPEYERVFRATNGLRTAEQIALIAGVSQEQAKQILGALAGIGSIVPAMSTARMMQQIEARDKQK